MEHALVGKLLPKPTKPSMAATFTNVLAGWAAKQATLAVSKTVTLLVELANSAA